ncbi:HNH endonuclease [Pseudarthrobacter sp. NPDC057230]|uniref:HNH endonuclease n=1 Tax=Pseudarthrobacter sp. NPDC057230 TaxID=3346057 RepID=UPI00363114EA
MNEPTLVIKYDPSKPGQQELLRKVLVDNWDSRCHWCGEAFPSATHADMDHIIPKKKFSKVKARLQAQNDGIYKEEFLSEMRLLPDDADDIHNIAPACRVARKCNTKKSDTITDDYMGVIVEGLRKAKYKKPKIIREVTKLLEQRGLTEHLVGCLALPDTEEVRDATRELGPQVLLSLWQVNKEIFEVFLPPDEVPLEMDAGELPDYFDTAFPSGTGLDGMVKLSESESFTLTGARVKTGVDAFAEIAKALNEAVAEIDQEMIDELGDMPNPSLVGPRFLSVLRHKINHDEAPEFEVRFSMSATWGGHAVHDSAVNNDGEPVYEDRQIDQVHEITCRVDLMDGEVVVDRALV